MDAQKCGNPEVWVFIKWVLKFVGTQSCGYANMWVSKYVHIQICGYSKLLVFKTVGIQMCVSTHFGGYSKNRIKSKLVGSKSCRYSKFMGTQKWCGYSKCVSLSCGYSKVFGRSNILVMQYLQALNFFGYSKSYGYSTNYWYSMFVG